MRKKAKKNKKKEYFLKLLPRISDLDSPNAANLLYFFLVTIMFSYAILIWSLGLNSENTHFSTPSNIESPLELKIESLTEGYPITSMTSRIARRDPKTAAMLVSVAKKESNWGKFSPQKDGRNCFNYWGYRGTYNQTDSGYSCFDSPRQAVREVGSRMAELMSQNIDTPSKMMVVWKCGGDEECAQSPSGYKWVRDVNLYYRKLN